MTFQTVVRSTRGLAPGDTVARLMPDGTASVHAFRIHEMITGHLVYREEIHFVYFLSGITAPFGKTAVKIVATEGTPWCVSS
jgi:hypothetical protein